MRAILYVVGSGLKGSRLRTTYLIMRSSTCIQRQGYQIQYQCLLTVPDMFLTAHSQHHNRYAMYKKLHDMPAIP